MADYLEMLPTTRIAPNDGDKTYNQPTDTVEDVSGDKEAAIVVTMQSMTYNGTAVTTMISIETAIENRDGHYMEVANIVDLTAVPGTFPQRYYAYLSGSSDASGYPGFARYLRVKVSFGHEDDTMALGVKAILKP